MGKTKNNSIKIECISEFEKIVDCNSEESLISRLGIFRTSFDKFSIIKYKDGNYPSIVTINGFTSEDKNNWKEWEEKITKQFPNNAWYHLEWNAERFPFDHRKKTDFKLSNKKKSFNIKISKILDTTISILPTGRIFYLTKSLINNFWHRAVRNSKIAGENLAKVLDACKEKEFILIGHSLGGRIIFNCLQYSHQRNLNICIVDIHLLGGAVSSNIQKWKPLLYLIKNKIYNYYSSNDYVLKSLYRTSMLSASPVGLTKIDIDGIENRDMSKIIKGHSEYISKFNTVKNYTRKTKREINREKAINNKERVLVTLKKAEQN